MQSFDFLVLGSGIAGLFYALQVAAHGRVALVTKKEGFESNTKYAQGGIAAVMSREDSFDLHVKDTLTAGAGLCRESVVRTIVSEGPARIEELIRLGVHFSHLEAAPAREDRELDLGREGGHSRRRILHAHDTTGSEVVRVLLAAAARQPNIRVFENHAAVDLITTRMLRLSGVERCVGAYVLDRAACEVGIFCAPVVVLATGGCGQVYLHSTNPDIATGDGVAMAYRAGVPIANMEFIQFHPTCLYDPGGNPFLISEALRGEGAVLKTLQGAEFMEKYHPLKSLAPRDVVARAIDSEMKKSGTDHVLLDITHKPSPFVRERFPNIYRTSLQRGIDITREPIPVVPAAHYQCGGVLATVDGATEIAGLYAIGEVACTGFHGANRLASNSLLEALVCGHRAALASQEMREGPPTLEIPPWNPGKTRQVAKPGVIAHYCDRVRKLMSDCAGIVRSNRRLECAGEYLLRIEEEIQAYGRDILATTDLLELQNMLTVARLIVSSALKRQESRGLQYNLDFPSADPDWAQRDTIIKRGFMKSTSP